jgi:ankyrin repeat protein
MQLRGPYRSWLLLAFFISLLQLCVAHAAELVPNVTIAEVDTAIQRGDTQHLAQLLDKNPLLANAVRPDDRTGTTPLHFAVLCQQLRSAELLLQKGAHVNGKDKWGRTPLHLAISSTAVPPFDFASMVRVLVENGADVNATTDGGTTPLHLAIACRKKVIANFLLRHGAKDGTTSLYDAIAQDDIRRIRQLLNQNVKLVNQMHPVRVSHPAPVAMPTSGVGNGAPIRRALPPHLIGAWSYDDVSPLHAAILYGNLGIVELLIDKGANLETEDREGETPLHEAVSFCNTDVVELLLKKGAKVDARTHPRPAIRRFETFRTPLHMAAVSCDSKMVSLLVAHGADVNAKTDFGSTPLDYAISANNTHAATVLLDRGADVNQHDKFSNSPLQLALDWRRKELSLLFLQRGADVTIKDRNGKDALEKAKEWGEKEVVAQILKRTAPLTPK